MGSPWEQGITWACAPNRSTQQNANGVVREGRVHAVGHGAAIFLAFVLAGSVPLLPFVLLPGSDGFGLSCLGAGIALFTVGGLRTFVTRARWFISGLEMLLIGSFAAAAAYGTGYFLRQLI